MRNQQDYIEKVIKQLVKETEIDFNNHRVKLEVANFSFPFYSFGGRRANAENLIAEPKGNFGNYVINTYGVNETEYKEIYAMYMGIIASRLQDHDENVNHLYLHEHSTHMIRMHQVKWKDQGHMQPKYWIGWLENLRLILLIKILVNGIFMRHIWGDG